jgi:Flp pilus assembly protein TadG
MSARQHGATTIEFALVLLAFLTFLLGIVDFARLLYMWNAATEATRVGARYAVVCSAGTTANDDEVLARMRAILPNISDATQISITWEPSPGQPAPCNAGTCQGVTVGITNLNFQWLSPITALTGPLPLPAFSTYLPREVMRQDPLSEPRWCATPTP